MNYVYLVESEKTDYKKENLTPEQKAFVDGIEFAWLQIMTAKNNLYDPEEAENTLQTIICETVGESLEQFRQWLHGSMCEYIVHSIDANEEGDQDDLPKETSTG